MSKGKSERARKIRTYEILQKRVNPRKQGDADYFRRLIVLALLLGGVFLTGTLGYILIEGWSLGDSIYMTIITVSTVGFMEVHPLGAEGRFLTAGLIISGVSLAAYMVGTLTQMIVEGKIRMVLGRRKMESKLQKMKNHIVVCGFGRIGRILCAELEGGGKPFVLVERDEEALREATDAGYLTINGNATDEDVLGQANLRFAEGLVSTISSDATNVFITLEAREMNPDLFIVTRSFLPKNEKHLFRSGADRVISPDLDGGHRMAQAVLRSAVHEFLELTQGSRALELRLDEVKVPAGCKWVGKTIMESDVRRRTGLIVVAVKRGREEMIFNPPPETVINDGDIFVTLGSGSHQEQFEKMIIEG